MNRNRDTYFVKKETIGEIMVSSYTNLSCWKIDKIMCILFGSDFKNLDNIYYKGGDYERTLFNCYAAKINANLIDLGNYRIDRYIEFLVNKYNICSRKRHSGLCRHCVDRWWRHCPMYETLAHYYYNKNIWSNM